MIFRSLEIHIGFKFFQHMDYKNLLDVTQQNKISLLGSLPQVKSRLSVYARVKVSA
jgi:hypothetical protein